MNKSCFKLTPVEEYNNILFKRDDKFIPYKDISINGGKVRQAISLLTKEYDNIKNEYGSTVATATSVHSPQGIIISRVAKEFGFKSIIGIGGLKDYSNHKLIVKCEQFNSEILILSNFGYNTTLYSKLEQLQKERKFFIIRFGMNAYSNPESILDTTSEQVKNIPDKLNNLVIPVGSAITAAGILRGIYLYDKKIKNIYLVQIAGFDRSKTLNSLVSDDLFTHYNIKYTNILYKKHPYSKELIVKFNDNEYLDPIYEAKAFEWLSDNINYKEEKTLFWIVGNSSLLRQ